MDHLKGDNLILFAVHQQDRHSRSGHAVQRAGLIHPESAEKSGPPTHKPASNPNRPSAAAGRFGNNTCGRIKSTVRHNALYSFGHRQFRGHQHCGRSHGNTPDKNGRILSESPGRILRPSLTVEPLPDAEGDLFAFALPQCPLVHHQNVPAFFPAQLETAAGIPFRRGAVPVEKQDQRCILTLRLIQFPHQLQSVIGPHRDPFIGRFHQFFDIGQHLLPMRIVEIPLRNFPDGCRPFLIPPERLAVAVIRTCRRQSGQSGQSHQRRFRLLHIQTLISIHPMSGRSCP